MIYRYMNCSTDGYFARGRHLRVVLRILPHGTHLHVVRIGAWCAFSPMVRILARGTHWRLVRILARGAFSRVVRILTRGAHSRAWCAFSRVVHSRAWCILARGTYLRVVRLAAAFEDRAIGDPAAINIGSVR